MQTIFPIYKPKGPTSHDIVYTLRKITGIKKIGHAGTLDPLAEGVLVVGITREGTKQMTQLVKKEKEYIAKIKLGEFSETDDAEGKKIPGEKKEAPNLEEIKEVIKHFIGTIKQVPPQYSAVKVKGQKAYKAARKGKSLELQPREVVVKDIELLDYSWPMLDLRIETGSGVYIRSIARDLGKALGTGAYLAELKRTRVGQFTEDQALSLEEFTEVWKKRVK